MEGSSERTKRAIDAVFGTSSGLEDDVEEDEVEELAEQRESGDHSHVDNEDSA